MLLLFLLVCWWLAFFGVLGWKPDFAYSAQRYFEWFLLGHLLISGALLPVSWRPEKWLVRVLLGLVLAAVLVVWSAGNGWLATRYLLSYFVFFLVVLAIAKTRAYTGKALFDRAALLGVVCLCFGASLIVLEGLLVSLSVDLISVPIIFGAFINLRMMAALQFATLLLLPAAWLLADNKRLRLWITITATVWWGWLFFSGTRAALLVMPVALVVVAICSGRACWPWLKRTLMQLLCGLAFYALLRVVLWQFGYEVVGSSMGLLRDGTSGRAELWGDAWQHFLLHPWFGNGPGAFACFTNELVAKPHNIVFLLLSEWGGVVTLLIAGLALFVFYVMAKAARQGQITIMGMSLMATVVAIVVAAQVQGILVSPLSQIMALLVFGWAWHEFSHNGFVSENAALGRPLKQGLMVLLVAALLAAWLFMAKQDLRLQKTLLTLPDGSINLSYGPRYWADGHDHCLAWHLRKIAEWQQETAP